MSRPATRVILKRLMPFALIASSWLNQSLSSTISLRNSGAIYRSSFEFSDEEFDLDVDLEAPSSQEDEEETPQGDEAPIVKYINKLLIDAIRMGASDLHFEPYEKSYRVRYRVDGVLRQIANPPLQLANRLASRLKVMSQMDISEKRVPQDGRIKLKLSKLKQSIFV